MKHSKKLVSVPETEYNALLGLLTGNDPMKKERLLTEQKIGETFSKPRLSALERGVRYQSLDKKRRMLNKKIDSKPIRVLLEQGKASVLPTEGIAPPPARRQQQQQIPSTIVAVPPAPAEAPAAAAEAPAAAEQQEQPRRTRGESLQKYYSIIDQNNLERLKARVDQFKDFFGINTLGQVQKDKNKVGTRIRDSDYVKVLEFLTGHIDFPEDQKETIRTLVPRLLKDDGVREMISADKKRQIGEGRRRRRYVVDLKPIKSIKTSKTRGLPRFKPLLWSKIPV